MPRTARTRFDAIVVDKENHAIALIEVKTRHPENWTTIVQRLLAAFDEPVAFVLTIDLDSIQLYRSGGVSVGEPIVHLDTMQVLGHYDPELPKQHLFESYLLTLVEAWLRDLAYHWKSENPPGVEELRMAGLLEKLDGGTTVLREV